MLAQFCSNSHPAVSAKGLPNSASGLKNARNTGRFHFPSVDVTLTRPNSTRVLYFTHPPPCRCRILTAPPICGYIMIHTDHFISFHIIHLDPEGPAKIFTTKRPWLPTTFSAPHSLRCPDPASTSSQCHDGPTGRPSFVALCQGFCDTWWPLVTCAWILTKSTVKVLKPELLRLDNIVNHRFQPFFAIFWVLQTTEFWETCEVGLGWSRPLIGDLPGRPGISMGFPWDFHGILGFPWDQCEVSEIMLASLLAAHDGSSSTNPERQGSMIGSEILGSADLRPHKQLTLIQKWHKTYSISKLDHIF